MQDNAQKKLMKKYKLFLPHQSMTWSVDLDDLKHNDINEEILTNGLILYRASLFEIFFNLQDYHIFEPKRLWSKRWHDNDKVLGVLDCCANETKLTPPFFRKHLEKSTILVADGNHRLSVAIAKIERDILFYVETSSQYWIESTIKSAEEVTRLQPNVQIKKGGEIIPVGSESVADL